MATKRSRKQERGTAALVRAEDPTAHAAPCTVAQPRRIAAVVERAIRASTAAACTRPGRIKKGHAHHRVPGRAHLARRGRPALREQGRRRRPHVPVHRQQAHRHRCRRQRQRGALHQSQLRSELRNVIENGRVFIEAIRRIKPGEELGYDYQLTWESTDDPVELALYACRCGAKQLPRHDAGPRAARQAKVGRASARHDRMVISIIVAVGRERRDRQRQPPAVASARRSEALQGAESGQADRHGPPHVRVHRPTAPRTHEHRGFARRRSSRSRAHVVVHSLDAALGRRRHCAGDCRDRRRRRSSGRRYHARTRFI